MQRIILYGSDAKSQIDQLLLQYLSGRIPFSFYRSGCFWEHGKKSQLEIFETEQLEIMKLSQSVVYLKQRANLKRLRSLSADTVVLVDSSRPKQLEAVSRFPAGVVTIGMSSKDIITFSSREGNECVIALQRTIRALDGTNLDPMEIPVSCQGFYNDGDLLAFTALLLLMNQISGKQRLIIPNRNPPRNRKELGR